MAGFLDYGSGKGLAVKHDWNKDIDNLFQSEALKARDQQEKEQKTAFYAKQLQEGKAVAPANTKRLEDFYAVHNKKVADFVIKNPNFETDVAKMTEFMSLTDQYLNNDIIREDQQVQEEFAKLKSAINNGKLRPQEEFAEMQKYNEYKDGKTKDPYIFSEPVRADVEGTIAAIAKNLPSETFTVPNKDGSKSQVRKVKFGIGENYETVAKNRLSSDPEIKWQIETGFNSSKIVQDMYGTPEKFLAKRLEQAADSYKVQSDAGTSNNVPLYSNYDADVIKAVSKIDPNLDFQVLGPSNPNLIALTMAGQAKGNVPIRAGGEFFDFITDKNDKNGSPILSKVHIGHNMKILQTYEPIAVRGVAMTRAQVNVEVPFGEEELNDEGGMQYHDVNTNQIIRKKDIYKSDTLTPAQEKEWSEMVKKNVAIAGTLATRFEAAGLKQKKSISEGMGFSGAAPSLRPPMIYEGIILQEINLSEQGAVAYQSQFNTPTQMSERGAQYNITNQLNRNIDNPEAFIALSKQNPTEAVAVVSDMIKSMPIKTKFTITSISPYPSKPGIYRVDTDKGPAYFNVRTKKFDKTKPS